jgi:hypothetical protein
MKILLEKNYMNLLTQKVIFSGRKKLSVKKPRELLSQNLFFSGRKERFCFAPESISSPQKAPDSILKQNRTPLKVQNRPMTDWREVFGVSLRVLERKEGKRKRNQNWV